jgi:glutamate N-acetyltransferase/amino-acid N-acetyltransferase
VAHSFNRITVDGDMSTNDTVLVLANGLAATQNQTRRRPRRLRRHFRPRSITSALELAKMIVRDGEGVHRVVTVRVNGAKTIQDADAAARAVANSALVKTSWHGGDPNWGRIIDAIGYSPATVVEEKVDIGYSAPNSEKDSLESQTRSADEGDVQGTLAAAAPKEFELHINLNLGKAGAVMYAADLTEQYVDFNKGDVTDPTTLGG